MPGSRLSQAVMIVDRRGHRAGSRPVEHRVATGLRMTDEGTTDRRRRARRRRATATWAVAAEPPTDAVDEVGVDVDVPEAADGDTPAASVEAEPEPARGPSAGSSPTPCGPPACATRSRCRASRSSACSTRSATPGIRVVATRHEGGAAFMAEAHGNLTGRPAACLGTRAVGAANLAIGIHTARQDSTPMFALVGQVERAHRGHEAFQEIDQVATIGGLAKWAAEPRDAADVATIHGEAVRQALGGRPGPGPAVAARGPARRAGARRRARRRRPTRPAARRRTTTSAASSSCSPRPNARSSWPAAASCAPGPRPTCCASPSCSRSRSSPPGAGRTSSRTTTRCTSGWPGSAPRRPCATASTAADAMLVIGCRLNEPTSYGDAIPAPDDALGPCRPRARPRPRACRPADLTRRAPTPGPSSAPPTSGCSAGPCSMPSGSRVRQATQRRGPRRVGGGERRRCRCGRLDGPGRPSRAGSSRRSANVLPDDAILTTDAGNFAGWAGRGFRFRRPGTFIGPTSGAMGYGLPAAIAAALVHRDRPVVALVGDGGLAMTMAELETAVRARAPGSSSSSSTTSATARSGCGRRLGAPASASGRSSGRSTSPPSRARCGARGVRVERDADVRAGPPRRPSPRIARRSSSSRSIEPGCRSTSRRRADLRSKAPERQSAPRLADDRERQRDPAAFLGPDVARGRPTSRSGARPPRSRRSPAPSSAVMTSPSVQARANFQSGRRRRSTGGRCTRAPSPSTPPARRSSRSRSPSSGRRSSASNSHSIGWPSNRTKRPPGASRRRDDGRPRIEVLQPHQRAATRVDEVGRPVELVRRVEHVRLDPARRRADRRRQPRRRARASAG